MQCCKSKAQQKAKSPRFQPEATSSPIELNQMNEYVPRKLFDNENFSSEDILDIEEYDGTLKSRGVGDDVPACCKSKSNRETQHGTAEDTTTHSTPKPTSLDGSYIAPDYDDYMDSTNYQATQYPTTKDSSTQSPNQSVLHGTFVNTKKDNYATYPPPQPNLNRSYVAPKTNDATNKNLEAWRSFQSQNNLRMRRTPFGINKTFPKTHVPPPSRNYSTYDSYDLRGIGEFSREPPNYSSAPLREHFRGGEGYYRRSSWGQTSLQPRSEEYSGRLGSWTDEKVIKQMKPSPRRMSAPPRMIETLPPENIVRNQRGYLRNLQTLPQYYNQLPHNITSPRYHPNRTKNIQPTNLTQPRKLYQTYYPAPPKEIEGNLAHYKTYTRQSSDNSFEKHGLNATLSKPQPAQYPVILPVNESNKVKRGIFDNTYSEVDYTLIGQRPLAQKSSERPQSAEVFTRAGSSLTERPKTAGGMYNEIAGGCNRSTCQKLIPFKANLQTSSAASAVTEKATPNGPFDTLLEIRTPHRDSASAYTMPIFVSINVSTGDKNADVKSFQLPPGSIQYVSQT